MLEKKVEEPLRKGVIEATIELFTNNHYTLIAKRCYVCNACQRLVTEDMRSRHTREYHMGYIRKYILRAKQKSFPEVEEP